MRYNPETDMVEICYNGVWENWKFGNMQDLLLYYYGDENTALTGGWSAYAYKTVTSNSTVFTPTITKESNRMKVSITGTSSSWYYGSVFADKTIDLTNIKTIEIVVNSVKNIGTSGNMWFFVTSTKENNYDELAKATITKDGTYTIDVTGLTGNHYVCFGFNAYNNTTSCYVESIKAIAD